MKKIILFTLAAALAAAPLTAEEPQQRVVSVGGPVTETVYALGAGDRLVGVDLSSVYPEEATKLPQIGYVRALSAEGILSLRPDLVLMEEDAGPRAVLKQLESAGVEIRIFETEDTPEAVAERTLKIAEVLGVPEEKARAVNEKMREELQQAQRHVEASKKEPEVLFIYARGGGVMNVAGKETSAGAIIELAGGKNAIEGFEGYKPLTPEAAVGAAPDVILVTSRGLESAGGAEKLLEHPGLSLTPAGRERRVVAMDDLLLLGFTPRLGEAALELSRKLHPGTGISGLSAAD